nr:putative integron gene cassette protein [uncultured bacterium]
MSERASGVAFHQVRHNVSAAVSGTSRAEIQTTRHRNVCSACIANVTVQSIGQATGMGQALILRPARGFAVNTLSPACCHLTFRSSRPRIVASATCLRYASTCPPPRCGAA